MGVRCIRFYLLVLSVMATSSRGVAQVTGVVIDMETRKPLRDVGVVVNGSYAKKFTTDYRGCFFISGEVKDLTFVHAGYEKRVMKRSELTDTIALLPKFNRIDEVVIYGNMPGKHAPVLGLIDSQLKSMPKEPSKAVVSGDFLSWLKVFEKGHVSAKKRRERMKAIENY